MFEILQNHQWAFEAASFIAVLVGLYYVVRIETARVVIRFGEVYTEIMRDMPSIYFDGRRDFSLKDLNDEDRRRALQVCQAYFNLLAQEKNAYEKFGFISRDIWRSWALGCRKNMGFLFMREAWDTLEWKFSDTFKRWMRRYIIDQRDKGKGEGWA